VLQYYLKPILFIPRLSWSWANNRAVSTDSYAFHYLVSDEVNDWNDHGIAKLLVCLCVGYRNRKRVAKTHEPGTFPRSKLPRISPSLRYQNFRTILTISCTQCAGNAIWICYSEAITVAQAFVFFSVLL